MPDRLDLKRLFVAVSLPPDIKKTFSGLQKELKTTGGDVKWVEPENIHLTIKFLGAVDTLNIPEIVKVLDRSFCKQKAILTQVTGLGAFPTLKRPRVLWADLRDDDTLIASLASRTENDLERLGFEKELRGFKPHVTLGRLRSSRNMIALIEKIEALDKNLSAKQFNVDNITLFESTLSPRGPAYSVVHQIKFK